MTERTEREPPRGRAVTISDVARHAGVAASTVSNVLSGKRTISLLGAPQIVYERDTGFARRTRDGVRLAAQAGGLRICALPMEPTYSAALEAVAAIGSKEHRSRTRHCSARRSSSAPPPRNWHSRRGLFGAAQRASACRHDTIAAYEGGLIRPGIAKD